MDCREAKPLLDPYVDRELDAGVARHVEDHLGQCPDCAAARERLSALRTAAHDLREDVPFSVALHARAAARAEFDRPLVRAIRSWRAAAIAASLVAMASVIWAIVAGNGTSPAAGGTLADELVAAHVRSLMAAHLLDVASSDQHTVKPWFIGKLDFAPDVRDFADAGFPLVGGRVDYIGGRPVAALVYRHDKHVINAFTWPAGSTGADRANAAARQGYHLVCWRDAEMRWCLVSDASASTLQKLEQLIEAHDPPTTTAAPGRATEPARPQ